MRIRAMQGAFAGLLVPALALVLGPSPAMAQAGSVLQTPKTPMELPIEVEIELSPAGSLKQALLWKELYQYLKNPYAVECTDPNNPYFCVGTNPRRPGFGNTMPAVNVYSLGYNFLTAQPMRGRTSDGETSWDQPGPLFDPDHNAVPLSEFNTPTTVHRTPIGHLVACPNDPPYAAADVPNSVCSGAPDGSLVVYNSTNSNLIPDTGTVVAVSVFVGGVLHEVVPGTTDLEPIVELEAPVNEEDFYRDPLDTTAVPAALRPLIGRPAAEILGKAAFWDMQVGSDGVQSCGSCHFHAGADNRTRNQLNPDINGGDTTSLAVTSIAGSLTTNVEVIASDFPFHKLVNFETPAEEVNCGTTGQPACTNANLISDANDVLSSMGVSRLTQFVDVPPIGTAADGTQSLLPAINAVSGIRALRPDLGTPLTEDALNGGVPVMQGVRRVEPRNTPTFHSAGFNFDNFWDGRARFVFNGGSVFGASDPTAHIFINPGLATAGGGAFAGATMGDLRPDLLVEDPEIAEQPVRIKFSSLGSQSVGPPLSDFEMSFRGRNHAKIGKKLLQGDQGGIQNQGNGAPQQAGTNRANAVAPLANQLVATDDSVLGPFSNQGGSMCGTLGRPTALGKPGLCISYPDLIRLAFGRQYWNRQNRHLDGAACADPFDGYCLTPANGAANPTNTNQFTQMEANWSTFFALAVQAYEVLTIPDHTPADQFFDANPNAGHAVGEPGDQAVLYPTLIRDLLDDGQLNGTNSGTITVVPGFGPDEVFGFDLFAGGNLTAGLPAGQSVGSAGRDRNPQITNSVGQTIRVGSNPFTRSAKCMLCHLGQEQTDHSINIAHGLLKNDAEFEFPVPPAVPDPTNPPTFPAELAPSFFEGQHILPAPEPSGSSRTVVGLVLAEEVGEGVAQDAVEVEPRDLAVHDDPATPWDDRIISQESNFAFGDQGVYNIGLRPNAEDIGRGGNDPFGRPLSLAALTLKNIGGETFEPCDAPGESCVMGNFDPSNIGATFEETGGGLTFAGSSFTLQSINPGFERDPITPQMPAFYAPWIHSLPAGELHPQIDEMAGMVPNTITPPNGGPGIEFPEIIFGADFHCARYDPRIFGNGPPNFGWGPPLSDSRLCPQIQSGVTGNMDFPSQGTWPVPNRVMRDGAFKAPQLRNVELTGPYFHTGSFLTLRQVVDFYVRGGDFAVANAGSRDPSVVDLDLHAFSFGRTACLPNPASCLDENGQPAECPPLPPGFDPICDPVNHVFSVDPPFTLVGSFGDGLPDTVFRYDVYPDSDHPLTPEPTFPGATFAEQRAAALEDAKTSIVKFLIALTDPRVRMEQAPFDRPEIFVPIDGAAPENALGRGTIAAAQVEVVGDLIGNENGICDVGEACVAGATDLLSLSGAACPVPGPGSAPTVPCFRHIPAVGAGGSLTPLPAFLGVTSIPPNAAGYNCSASAGPVSHFCSTISP